jgi:aldehyde dehydrogenase (NAD+)
MIRERMQRITLGPPTEESTQMGPQVDAVQAAAIGNYLDIGRNEGSVVSGGKTANEFGVNYIQPTLFANILESSKINIEEVFGPVLVSHSFDTEDEVVRLANDTECEFSQPR